MQNKLLPVTAALSSRDRNLVIDNNSGPSTNEFNSTVDDENLCVSRVDPFLPQKRKPMHKLKLYKPTAYRHSVQFPATTRHANEQ